MKPSQVWPRALLAAALSLLHVAAAFASDCPPGYDFNVDNVDYYDPEPARQAKIRGIESNHMNQSVRSLQKGQTTTNASGDLKFVLGIVPNHPEALTLLARKALRDRTDRFPDIAPLSVECWLHRATVFRPNDATSLAIYGVYLARRGKTAEAIGVLEQADTLKPGNANVAYNLGLMYLEQRNYARAREYAKRAYEAGFPLPGLKDKLRQAGHWSD